MLDDVGCIFGAISRYRLWGLGLAVVGICTLAFGIEDVEDGLLFLPFIGDASCFILWRPRMWSSAGRRDRVRGGLVEFILVIVGMRPHAPVAYRVLAYITEAVA